MDYAYYRHDGFVFRRPTSPDDTAFPDPATFGKVEIWHPESRTWVPTISSDDAMQPLYYGVVLTKDEADQQTTKA